MPTQTTFIKASKWRTIHWVWKTVVSDDPENIFATILFRSPPGARIKLRLGIGRFGYNSQRQTLDGNQIKKIYIYTSHAMIRARVQVSVQQDTNIVWAYFPGKAPNGFDPGL